MHTRILIGIVLNLYLNLGRVAILSFPSMNTVSNSICLCPNFSVILHSFLWGFIHNFIPESVMLWMELSFIFEFSLLVYRNLIFILLSVSVFYWCYNKSHKLSGLPQHKSIVNNSGNQKSEFSFTGWSQGVSLADFFWWKNFFCLFQLLVAICLPWLLVLPSSSNTAFIIMSPSSLL